MKRGPGPQRKTEMARGTGLARGQGLQRSAPMPRSPPDDDGKPKRRRPTPAAPKSVLDLVKARDGNQCVACGLEALRLETHHRRRKGMGGSKLLDHPANLIRLCGWGNSSGCHGNAHRWRVEAEARGLCVPEGADIASWPVRYWNGWWLLDNEGGAVAYSPPADLE